MCPLLLGEWLDKLWWLKTAYPLEIMDEMYTQNTKDLKIIVLREKSKKQNELENKAAFM
jgi:hypothetical protein